MRKNSFFLFILSCAISGAALAQETIQLEKADNFSGTWMLYGQNDNQEVINKTDKPKQVKIMVTSGEIKINSDRRDCDNEIVLPDAPMVCNLESQQKLDFVNYSDKKESYSHGVIEITS